ncbi:MAG: hypothetical protein NC342_04595 [Pseudoflavonifractor sp.]|nr:hypothetical protein [Alloprevotella sp.]MCM1116796.1 hypothetical protein [Pseudoflavonifractor sp.]
MSPFPRFTRSAAPLAVILLLSLQGCFTGVESTPRISEKEYKEAVSTRDLPEARFLADIHGEPPSSWRRGKQWVVTDSRSDRAIGRSLEGDTISLSAISESISILGLPEAVVSFSSPLGDASYMTGISPDSLMRRQSLNIPYTVELSLISELRQRLIGQTFYVATSLWGDMDGNSIRGLKYIPVEVTGVEAGRGIEPIRLSLQYLISDQMRSKPGKELPGDSTHRHFTLPMALPGGGAGGTTRSFANLFSLSDPRKRYPKISDAAWLAINEGRVIEGMTRDECRLSLGSPTDIDRRPGYSSLQEIWTYPDGIRLIFIDGLLIQR